MNWAIVIPAGIGIAVLLSIALVANRCFRADQPAGRSRRGQVLLGQYVYVLQESQP